LQQRQEATDGASGEYSVEDSPFGRIVVAPGVPVGFALFYTTLDFHGRLDDSIARGITAFIDGRFGIRSSLTTCVQVHGIAAKRAENTPARAPAPHWRECDSCDALWSAERGVALGIKVADCLPLTMIDPIHEVLANIHSGWRGTVQGIAASTLDALEESTPFDPREASAWLGPSIRECCFEVGDEVASQFDAQYVDRTRDKAHVDLPRMTVDVLRRRGFRDDRIHDSRLCTRCSGSIFHSLRRDSKSGGRTLAIAAH
jgi:YfiH family protein